MEILVESQGSPSGNRVVEINPSRGGNVCLAQPVARVPATHSEAPDLRLLIEVRIALLHVLDLAPRIIQCRVRLAQEVIDVPAGGDLIP